MTAARRRALAAGALAAGGLAAAALLARRAGLEPMLVEGTSMQPTLRPGQRVAVAPLAGPPPRGAIVVLRRPGDERTELVKRVVGLPGERLRLAGGRVEVDGRPLPEPYLAGPGSTGPGSTGPGGTRPGTRALELALGAGEYLVLGDHRGASTDGRDFGPVRSDGFIGVVRFAYWPPRRLALRG